MGQKQSMVQIFALGLLLLAGRSVADLNFLNRSSCRTVELSHIVAQHLTSLSLQILNSQHSY